MNDSIDFYNSLQIKVLLLSNKSWNAVGNCEGAQCVLSLFRCYKTDDGAIEEQLSVT